MTGTESSPNTSIFTLTGIDENFRVAIHVRVFRRNIIKKTSWKTQKLSKAHFKVMLKSYPQKTLTFPHAP